MWGSNWPCCRGGGLRRYEKTEGEGNVRMTLLGYTLSYVEDEEEKCELQLELQVVKSYEASSRWRRSC
jgi:hypothetical protein